MNFTFEGDDSLLQLLLITSHNRLARDIITVDVFRVLYYIMNFKIIDLDK